MEKKYELVSTPDVKPEINTRVYRIRALKDFGDVKAGELGGWVESEDNLAQDGNCWIEPTGCVYDKARVVGDTIVVPTARIGNAALIKSTQDYLYIREKDATAYIGGDGDVYVHLRGYMHKLSDFPTCPVKRAVSKRFSRQIRS